jgi:hypothetical protein
MYSVSPVVPASSVTLFANKWVGDGDVYSQVVAVPGVTARSKVDLQPTSEQLEEFHYKTLAFVAENVGGVVTVFSVGDKPAGDHTIQITLTEVEGMDKIRGNTVGTTMPQPDWNQTDPTKADYIKNKPEIKDFGGLTTEAATKLITILRNAVFLNDISGYIDALEDTFLLQHMVGISAVYNGRAVSTEMAVQNIQGIVVTALLPTGYTRTVEKYAITGNLQEGDNILTISYNGFSTTVRVPAINAPALCTITKNMTNAYYNNSLDAIPCANPYGCKITAKDGSVVDRTAVLVTMGGIDVTDDVYDASTGFIYIEQVTGHIVITVVAPDSNGCAVINNLTNVANSNTATSVEYGSEYVCDLTPLDGYALKSVVITMGGVEQINFEYDRSPIYQHWQVASVTGNIVITAIAEGA